MSYKKFESEKAAQRGGCGCIWIFILFAMMGLLAGGNQDIDEAPHSVFCRQVRGGIECD